MTTLGLGAAAAPWSRGSSPSPPAICSAPASSSSLVSLLAAVLTVVVAVAASLVLVVLFALCTASVFAFVGHAIKEPSVVPLVALAPPVVLGFASSAIVPVATMPGWIQAFARTQPASVTAKAARALMNDGVATASIGMSLLWSLPLHAGR